MFDSWKQRRQLRQKIILLQKQRDSIADPLANLEQLTKISKNIGGCKMQIDAIDTDRLMNTVHKLGIELPAKKADWWWDDMDDVGPEDYRSYLTERGKMGVSKLIRDERKKNIEWWAKIIGTVITLLTGLVGSIIGVLAILYK
jgi:hypothetical protein